MSPSLRLTKHATECEELSWAAAHGNIVGAAPDCDIVLDERGVSRRHCVFAAVNAGWTIRDLDSTNGTFVNDVKLVGDEQLLQDGDQIGIGEAKLVATLVRATEDITEILTHRDRLPTTELLQAVTDRESMLPDTVTFQIENRIEREDAKTSGFSLGATANDGSRILLPCTFHQFTLIERIGGGMGEVFLAESSSTKRKFAIKFLRARKNADASDRARFLREIEITLALKHPALIDCLEYGEEYGELFFVMEYCSGGNLAELLDRSGPLSLRRALRLMDRVLAGVAHAHGKSIVHRDLKPSNVLLQLARENRFHPKVSDFGLAKNYTLAGESGMTISGSVGGSWRYMPREQLLNFRYTSPQSDVWSLGAILYECITGKLPRPMTAHDDPFKRIVESRIVPIVELVKKIPAPVSQLVMKSLSAKTEDRFRDAQQMRKALRNAASLANIDL